MQALGDCLRDQHTATRQDKQDAQRDAAIAAWRSALQGEGNSAFYRLGTTLKQLGLPHAEIAAILRQETAFAQSPKDRRNQIKSILKDLTRRPSKIAA
jgi:hypothetical protein